MTNITINDLKEHNHGDIEDSECTVKVIRSGKVNFNGSIKVRDLNLHVDTSGKINFNEDIIADRIGIEVSTTAGIWMNKIKSGRASINIHTGKVYLTYKNDISKDRIELYVGLKNYGKLYVSIPKGSSVCVVGQNGYSNIDYNGVSQNDSSNCDYYIVVNGKMSSRLELNYN